MSITRPLVRWKKGGTKSFEFWESTEYSTVCTGMVYRRDSPSHLVHSQSTVAVIIFPIFYRTWSPCLSRNNSDLSRMASAAEMKAILIAPMVTSPISFVASAVLIVMMLRSELKLTVPSRRIFFGLCAYDLLQSAGSAFSSVPIPKGQGVWGSMGNVHTCNLQGCV